MIQASNFLLFNGRGHVLPKENYIERYFDWRRSHPSEDACFGPLVKHTWEVNGETHERLNPRDDLLDILPDHTGFLLCENVQRPDNLLLLDVYGRERMRLSIPWQLTRHPTPDSAAYPSRFIGPTSPWDNPKTGQKGQFAVLTWVEYAGDYAFELDWKTGQFLWGYYLERG